MNIAQNVGPNEFSIIYGIEESHPEGAEPIISLENLYKVVISLNRVLQKGKKHPHQQTTTQNEEEKRRTRRKRRRTQNEEETRRRRARRKRGRRRRTTRGGRGSRRKTQSPRRIPANSKMQIQHKWVFKGKKKNNEIQKESKKEQDPSFFFA